MNQNNLASRGITPALLRRLVGAVRAGQTANDFFDDCLTGFLGVSRVEGRCLDIIDRLGPVTAGRLAAESGLSTGAVTALVDRMERHGYMRRSRDSRDRRRIYIELTEAVKTLTAHLFGSMDTLLEPMLERLGPREIEAIAFFLEADAWINQNRARLLQDHLPDAAAGFGERLALARTFESNMDSLATSLCEEIRAGRPLLGSGPEPNPS